MEGEEGMWLVQSQWELRVPIAAVCRTNSGRHSGGHLWVIDFMQMGTGIRVMTCFIKWARSIRGARTLCVICDSSSEFCGTRNDK
jgi:hypothetical protein